MNVQFAIQIASAKRDRGRAAGATLHVHDLRPGSQSARQPDGAVRLQGDRRAAGPLAALVMVGKTLDELGLFEEVVPKHFSVKESVFPFNKFPGVDIILGPEMRSTGEVMGIDDTFPDGVRQEPAGGQQRACRQVGHGLHLAWRTATSTKSIPIARSLAEMGYRLISTRGTAKALRAAGIEVEEMPKLQEGRPNLIDHMKNDQIALVINTPSGKGARTDEGKIRAAAVANGVTCITTLAAAQAAVEACRASRERQWTVCALQDRFSTKEKNHGLHG